MRRSIPWWTWAVLGFLTLACGWERLPSVPSEEVRALARALTVEHDPRRMNARELRQLPGVGHKLALALVHARAASPRERPLDWEDVPGIGAIRARAIRAWCRARGVDPDPLCAGAPLSKTRALRYPCAVFECARMLGFGVAALLLGCRDGALREGLPSTTDEPGQADPLMSCPRTLALQGGSLHALEAGPHAGPVVLLLHGARFSARTWEELGTLEKLARAGYHALAIDWPGFGATPKWSSVPDPATLIGSLCAELGAEPVALVAPSMGGGFALEFTRHSPERVAALVAVAPAGAADFEPSAWSTPTLLLWGEHDEVVSLAQGEALAARLSGARLAVLPGASHPCYLDQPQRFHALLAEFLAAVVPPEPRR